MNADESQYDSIIELLNNGDLAYAFKKKRLRYLRSASVNKEVLYLRDHFFSIWEKRNELYFVKEPYLTEQGREIIYGLLGDVDSALAMLKINQGLALLEREKISAFFELHIASKSAQRNLTSILFDGDYSLICLARRQIPYLEQYIPTMEKFKGGDFSDLSFSQHDIDNILHFLSRFDDIEQNLSLDIQRYKEFEKDFFRLYREDSKVDIVGYGEISTVMRLNKNRYIRTDIVSSESMWIWKKMPPFQTKEDVDRYLRVYEEYRKVLNNDIGITVPVQTARFFRHGTFYQVYAGQERVNSDSICNAVVRKLAEPEANRLLRIILKKLSDVYVFNKTNHVMIIGIDAQLSNWALDFKNDASVTVSGYEGIRYIDTSSPMIRVNGVEQIDPEIFIKSAASFLRPIIRRFFLQQVLDRYYDIRLVTIDIIANLHKEKRADLIDSFIKTTNEYFKESEIDGAILTRKEIDAYYSNDAFIWKFYQASRKIDRFITEKILRKKYMFRIPENIER